jgi:5,5'-dehydrodivanillate O-demethylase
MPSLEDEPTVMTREENDALTRVGAGTPAGELLRRYWHPVAAACEIDEDTPIKRVRILGEDLVVFQLRTRAEGEAVRYGLVEEQCSHRLVSLANGRVDTEGIRCPYHGWKFGPSGACLEQPAEPPDSTYKDRITHRAYPVQKLGGLLFAYMGPQPAPLLPRWDVLAREDGRRWGVIESVIDCNWLPSTRPTSTGCTGASGPRRTATAKPSSPPSA